jgi:ABC-type uncharacterized transport system fused permease/ATPase subunit
MQAQSKMYQMTAAIVAVITLIFALQTRALKQREKRFLAEEEERDPDATMRSGEMLSFLQKLRTVVAIAVPKWRCTEVAGSLGFICLFGIKAWASFKRANADGNLVAAFVTNNNRTETLAAFVNTSLVLATVTGLIEQTRLWLIARYRGTLTRYFHGKLFAGNVFYRASMLDDRLLPGTAIATYCHEFAEHFAELPYYFLLPAAEAGSALYFLGKQAGTRATAQIAAGTLVSLFVLRGFTPRFGKMHAIQLDAEERFRLSHADVQTHTEQIALHQGGKYMFAKLVSLFGRVQASHVQVAIAKGGFTLLQTAMSLTLWDTMVLLLAAQMLKDGATVQQILSTILVQRQMIRKFHDSVELLIDNVKEASHLHEFTEKLAAFDTLLVEAHRTMPVMRSAHAKTSTEDLQRLPSMMVADDDDDDDDDDEMPLCGIVLQDVSVVTPGDQVLVKGLTITVKKGESWVILGPNGCGKTSILRLLAGLWQPGAGSITMTPSIELNFLPQAAFLLSNVTLFEQLAFPDTLTNTADQRAVATPKDIAFAKTAMSNAFAETIVQLLGGWYSPMVGFTDEQDDGFKWESLSGGQKQKVAIARLFFRAQMLKRRGIQCFAMMDESTSQIDAESEDVIFLKLKTSGVTYVSVTHRERLLAHHDRGLKLDPGIKSYSVHTDLTEDLIVS